MTLTSSSRRPTRIAALLALVAVAALLDGCSGNPFWQDLTSTKASAPVFHTGWGRGQRHGGIH